MQLVPSSGTDRHVWEQGLALWRKGRGIRVQDTNRECRLECAAGADHKCLSAAALQ